MDTTRALAAAVAITVVLATGPTAAPPVAQPPTPPLLTFAALRHTLPVVADTHTTGSADRRRDQSRPAPAEIVTRRRAPRDEHDPAAADYPNRTALPEAVVHAQNPDQLDRARWAMQRFHLARLELPDQLEIWFHGDRGTNPGCGGNRGTRTGRDDLHIVNVCSPAEFTLLHELGHAWAAITLTDSTKGAFVAMRDGAHSWADPGEKWSHKGTEHAADIMAWGLLDPPVRPLRTLPNDDQSLTDAYRFLTGTDPLHHTAKPDRYPTTAPQPSSVPIEHTRTPAPDPQ